MQLSEHFSLEELTASETASRLSIDNYPNDTIKARLKDVTAPGMEQVRAFLGHPILVTSGYRSLDLNKVVPGSSNTSAHTLGYAVDFKCPAFGTPYEVCQALATSGIQFDQIIHEYRAWTHISFDPKHRMQLLTKNTGRPYTAGIFR